ncbi:MAG: glycosyltransferase [bacterium JZ-2024 1]
MTKSINIITNLDNGAGLQRDATLLANAFATALWEVRPIHVFRPNSIRPAYANLFLEIPNPQLFDYARFQWIIPNPEWWYPEWDELLPSFHRVFCKTQSAHNIFSRKTSRAVKLDGFLSDDLFIPTQKERSFIHFAGKSFTKNTEAVIETWRKFDITVPLYLIASRYPNPYHHSIIFRPSVSDQERIELMNKCWFHLCPSAYEGWGHYIHEAMSTASVVITTDAEPMNEFVREILVPVSSVDWMNSAPLFRISPDSLYRAIEYVLSLSDTQLSEISSRNRDAFCARQQRVRKNIVSIMVTS